MSDGGTAANKAVAIQTVNRSYHPDSRFVLVAAVDRADPEGVALVERLEADGVTVWPNEGVEGAVIADEHDDCGFVRC